MVEVSTSILNVEKEKSMQTFYNLEVAHTDYFHIDVMDGKFVKKDTTEDMFQYAVTLNGIIQTPLDIHLMVEEVEEYIYDYQTIEPNSITFHIEATKTREKTMEYIKLIKEGGSKVGLSIKPDTKIEEIYPYLPYIHMVLVMTVEPGKGGQTLIPDTIEKIRKLREFIEENKLEVDIEVDGGINVENASILKAAGADILVAGTAILHSKEYEKTIKQLKE